MYQLKQMLNDLVEYTFKDDPRLKAYKAFTIETLDKNFKSRLGDYDQTTRHIRITNIYRDENKLIITAVHELAHHVNFMQGNEDAHGKGFYANYEKLLHGALDMKLITKSEWMTTFSQLHDAVDENKVNKMIERYKPKDAEYKKGRKKITVYDAFDIKDELKAQGFSYNKIVKGWDIETDEEKVKNFQMYLDQKEVKYTVSDASKYIVKKEEDKKPYILSVKGGYPIKDKLREAGYRYRQKDQCWYIRYEKFEWDKLHKQLEKICEESNCRIQRQEKLRLVPEINVVVEQIRENTEAGSAKKDNNGGE